MVPSWMQIALVVLLVVLLFGRGKISDLMGDLAKGIKSFKSGLSEDPETTETKPTDGATGSLGSPANNQASTVSVGEFADKAAAFDHAATAKKD